MSNTVATDGGSPSATPRRGSLESGWNRIVRDFDAAVLDAPFTALELFLIGKARFASWTLATLDGKDRDPLPFRLDFDALAAIKGVNPRYLASAFRGLVAKNVFCPADGPAGHFLIVKDYGAWVSAPADAGDPVPLLDAGQVADADAMRDDLVAAVESWAAVARPAGQKFLPARQKNLPRKAEKPAIEAEIPASEGRKTCLDGQKFLPPHIDEARTASGDLRELRETNNSREATVSKPGTPEGRATLPLSGPSGEAEAIARRIAGRFREAPDDNELYGLRVRGWLRAGYTPEEIRLAVAEAERGSRASDGRGFCSYAAKVLENQGRREPRPAAPRAASPDPYPGPDPEIMALIRAEKAAIEARRKAAV